jgi:hypothetical protein
VVDCVELIGSGWDWGAVRACPLARGCAATGHLFVRHKIPCPTPTNPAKSPWPRPPTASAALPACSTTGSTPSNLVPAAAAASGFASPGTTRPRPSAAAGSISPPTSTGTPAPASCPRPRSPPPMATSASPKPLSARMQHLGHLRLDRNRETRRPPRLREPATHPLEQPHPGGMQQPHRQIRAPQPCRPTHQAPPTRLTHREMSAPPAMLTPLHPA